MKYGIWNVGQPESEKVEALVSGGYSPLVARILAARGMENATQADKLLDCCGELQDPYLMTDMQPAVNRIKQALSRREKIAVFGDYDVDGVTATCLLTDFLRSRGGDCIPYIPGRLEEGYGLNAIAIEQLYAQGVRLIVTVDCGITAVEQARMCKSLGIDLIITDHHECKDLLPGAVAVIDPHRPDGGYPHLMLSGVGVAFKLAAAICESQEEILRKYADMVCLGTVADVMPLCGENRVFVSRGLEALRNTNRPGIAALIQECGCEASSLNASNVGYMLAPRINAAGRMGKIDLAVELFLTREESRGQELAKALCDLNRERQAVESEIYQQVYSMIPKGTQPSVLVLADERWHQGVVGIVASRIAEEFCCPTILICLDGQNGKASSRSYGGFNLFAALTKLSPLLLSYGGHELAAGFTIARDKIDIFRDKLSEFANMYYREDAPRTVLEADCSITSEMMTLSSIESLEKLEPCGNGCPRPVLVMENLQIERMIPVGGGKHLRLRLKKGKHSFSGIFFSATPQSLSVEQGDKVDVAFTPQINEYRQEKTVQMNFMDIRPACKAQCFYDTAGYRRLRAEALLPEDGELLPSRETQEIVWRYFLYTGRNIIEEEPMCLLRKIVRYSEKPLGLGTLMVCLDIFADVGLIEVKRQLKYISIRLLPVQEKADLSQSVTMQRLMALKESE